MLRSEVDTQAGRIDATIDDVDWVQEQMGIIHEKVASVDDH